MTAAELLESFMLICFGLSWPMSVYKNIKARSAKNMSLPFIILICLGYIAGIAAKIITNNLSYVLIVYALNLAIVSANAVVYFINKRLDQKAVSERKKSNLNENHSSIQRKAVSK